MRARDTTCQTEHERGVVVNKGVGEGKLTDELIPQTSVSMLQTRALFGKKKSMFTGCNTIEIYLLRVFELLG